MTARKKKAPGPKPERLHAEDVDWQDALKHALNKPKPEKGWDDGEAALPEQRDAPDDSDESATGA